MTAENNAWGPGLRFGVLGPLEVRLDGAPLTLGGRQQRAILGMLLCEGGHAISVERMADALWGEHLPRSYQATVKTYVFHLRTALEPSRPRGAAGEVLTTEPGGTYRLNTSVESVDAHRFEELVRRGGAALESDEPGQALDVFDDALALWRGDVLADLTDFDFVSPTAVRLRELRLCALESRIEAELALGHHNTAVAELDRLVVDYPMRERLHAQRILALYRSDRQSDALNAYRDLRTHLRDELGVEPGPSVQELHQRVLAQDAALDWAPRRPNGPRPQAMQETALDLKADSSAGRSERRELLGRIGHMPRRAVATGAALVVIAAGTSLAVTAFRPKAASLPQLPANSVGSMRADGSIASDLLAGSDPDGAGLRRRCTLGRRPQ